MAGEEEKIEVVLDSTEKIQQIIPEETSKVKSDEVVETADETVFIKPFNELVTRKEK